MRLHIKINAANQDIPFNYQHLLTGTIHKWLGKNHEHGNVSLYSFSRIEGVKATKQGFHIENGCSFFFSAHDPAIVKQLVSGVQTDATMFNGLKATELIIQQDPDLATQDVFYNGSPIFIKRRDGERVKHILYSDENAAQYLKETLQTKLALVGLSDETLDIQFDTSYKGAGTKLVHYKNIKNRASWCPIIIKAKPETKTFAWNVGLGNSTGIGFGAIK